jgi:hypothetical protein
MASKNNNSSSSAASSNESSSILTPENKQNPNFKKKLASLTRSDAHHDLKKVFNETSYKEEKAVRDAYDSGIPVPAKVSFHELEAFASIVISATDSKSNTIEINNDENKLNKAFLAVPNCTPGYNGDFSTFKVGIDPNTPLFDFKVVQFIIQCSNNSLFKDVPNLADLACKSDFGKRFVDNVKLGEDGNEAAIIVDFTQHGFVEGLTEGEDSTFTVHYLMTPEVVNDPAGKPNVNNQLLFGEKTSKKKGVNLISYVEETNDVTSYTKFDEDDPNTSNNFFSNYDFTLSPIKKIITNQKAEKLITTLNIKYDNGTRIPLTDTVEDSKGENSIKNVTSHLKKIMELIKKKFDIATAFDFNSKIQQKRGGDWFQALACINARNRYYNQILPILPNKSTELYKLNDTCPVYLVTHDRIAVTFALLNGVNVIYLDYYGRIFVFKNLSDTTLKGSGKPTEQILFEGIKAKWFGQSNRGPGTVSVGAGQLSQIIATAQRYTQDRNDYLFEGRGIGASRQETSSSGKKTGKIPSFYVKCEDIKTELSKIAFNDTDNKQDQINKFQKSYTEQLKKLFTAAVELTFININLINVKKDIDFVEENQKLFNGEYKEENKKLVAEFSKALNNIKGIRDKFGDVTGNENFYNAFDNWFNGNIKKLDVYKCANKILEIQAAGEEDTIFDFQRIISFFTRNPPDGIRQTDMHIFLPFIQDIDIVDNSGAKTLCRNSIIQVLDQLVVPQIEKYYETDNSITTKRIPKIGLHPNMIYYNNLSNLVYESFIFIDDGSSRSSSTSTSVASSEASSPISKLKHEYSTDNKLLDSDFKELKMMEEGKYSNFTGNTRGSGKNEDTDISGDDPKIFEAKIFDTENAKGDIEGNVNISDESGSKVYNLRCTVTGKTINCQGARLEKDGGEQEGGRGYIAQYGDVKERTTNGIESVICDISLKQVIWPLISANLIEKTSINSLENFQKQIKQYIVLETLEASDVTKGNIGDGDIGDIDASIGERGEREIELSEQIKKIQDEKAQESAKKLSGIANQLFKRNIKKGGNGDSSETPIVSKDLMTDFNLGFHPLTPIYAMLSSYYNIIGPKSQSDPFFYTHFTYVNVLEKMKKVLEENYLSNTLNSPNTASAYMIGFGLYFMLFASHTSTLQNDTILQVLNMTQKEYFEFSLKNDGFGSLFLGSVNQTPEDEANGIALLNNELFNNFVNNEVNIKQILQQSTPVQNLPDYTVLQDRMFNLMGEIVVKVNADRGTPIGASDSASGVEPVTGLASGIAGLSVEEQAARVARLEEQQKKLPESSALKKRGLQDTSKLFAYSKGKPDNVVTSTTSSSIGRRGGKRSKRYINKKRKITKRKKGGKTNRNKTLKKAKVYRKTRKH